MSGQSVTVADDALEVGRLLQGDRDAVVVLTRGQQGVAWIGEEAFWLPAIPTASVDATRAGDAVAAVAIYGTLTELAPERRTPRPCCGGHDGDD